MDGRGAPNRKPSLDPYYTGWQYRFPSTRRVFNGHANRYKGKDNDFDPSMQGSFSEDTSEDPRCSRPRAVYIALFILALLVVAGIAAAIATAFLVNNGPKYRYTRAEVKLRVLNVNYTEELSDKTSLKFAALQNEFCANVGSLVDKDKSTTGYQGCTVESARKGSVIIVALFYFVPQNQAPVQVAVTNIFKPSSSSSTITVSTFVIETESVTVVVVAVDETSQDAPAVKPVDENPTSSSDTLVETSSPGVVVGSSSQGVGVETSSANVVVETSSPGVVVETSSPGVVVETSSPGVVVETSSPGVVVETSSQEVVVETSSPGVVVETSSPGVVVETSSPGVVVETSSQDVVVETSSPGVVVETSSQGVVVETSSPGVVVETSSPGVVVETSSPGVVVETSSPGVVVETSSPGVVVETSSPGVVVETSSQGVVVETLSPGVVVETSSQGVVVGSSSQGEGVETSSANVVVETSSPGVVVETSSPGVVVETSSPGVVVETSSPGVVVGSSSQGVGLETSSANVVVETSSPGVVVETSSPGVVVETSSQGVVVETSSQTVIVETSSQGVIVETSSQTVIVETSSQAVIVETSSQGEVGETSSPGVVVETSRPGVVVETSSQDVVVETSSQGVVVGTSSPGVVVETSSQNLIVETSSPGVIVETSSQGVVVETSSQGVVVETSSQAVGVGKSSPGVVVETSSLGVVVETSSPGVVVETSSMNVVVETSSPGVVVETSSTNVVVETSSPGVVVETSSPGVVVETSSQVVVVETSSPGVVVETSSQAVGVETSSPGVVVETSSPGVVVETSSPGVVVETSSPGVVVETSSPGIVVETSSPGVVVETSSPGVVVETSSPDVSLQTSSPDVSLQASSPDISLQASSPYVSLQASSPDSSVQTSSLGEPVQTTFSAVINTGSSVEPTSQDVSSTGANLLTSHVMSGYTSASIDPSPTTYDVSSTVIPTTALPSPMLSMTDVSIFQGDGDLVLLCQMDRNYTFHSVHFFKNGVLLVQSPDISDNRTEFTYRINNPRCSDTGGHECRVESEEGNLTTTANVTVLVRSGEPTLTLPFEIVEGRWKETSLFVCTYRQGVPPAEVYWSATLANGTTLDRLNFIRQEFVAENQTDTCALEATSQFYYAFSMAWNASSICCNVKQGGNTSTSCGDVYVVPSDICLSQTGKFEHPYSCQLWIACVNDVVYIGRCPEGHCIDVQADVCVLGSTVAPTGTTTTDPFSCKNRPTGDNIPREYTLPNHCKDYYVCANGSPFNRTCAGSSFFIANEASVCTSDYSLSYCAQQLTTTPSNATGNDASTTMDPGNVTTSAPPSKCDCSFYSYIVRGNTYPDNCTLYYWCVNGVKTPYECGPGLQVYYDISKASLPCTNNPTDYYCQHVEDGTIEPCS